MCSAAQYHDHHNCRIRYLLLRLTSTAHLMQAVNRSGSESNCKSWYETKQAGFSTAPVVFVYQTLVLVSFRTTQAAPVYSLQRCHSGRLGGSCLWLPSRSAWPRGGRRYRARQALTAPLGRSRAGDSTPVSAAGEALACVLALVGVGLFALPAGKMRLCSFALSTRVATCGQPQPIPASECRYSELWFH